MPEIPESSSSDDDAAAKAAYKEKLQSLTFGRVPGGSRTSGGNQIRRDAFHASWEKGIKGEERRDGSFMPYLNAKGDPIRMKDWAENRHTYQAVLDQKRTSSTED